MSVAPAQISTAISHTSRHGGWQVQVPVDTAEHHRLPLAAPAPELGQQLDPPATGWHVGLILLIPTFALAATTPPIGAATTRLPAAERGRCAQITVLLGGPHAAELDPAVSLHDIAESPTTEGPVARGVASQVWQGQTALPPR